MARLNNFKRIRQLGIYLLAALLLFSGIYALSQLIGSNNDEYERNIKAKVGEALVIDVPGRVSIEYRWQINTEKSKGLELLDISHIGWIYPIDEDNKKTRSSFGAPRTAKFYIQPKAPGVIQLVLEYKKRGIVDDFPQRVRDYTILVEP